MKFTKLAFNLIFACFVSVLFVCTGCNGSSSSNSTDEVKVEDNSVEVLNRNLQVPNHQRAENYNVILYGNSHISGLSSLIRTLITSNNPEANIVMRVYGGGFLDESYSSDNARTQLIQQGRTHAIFQGQKYSQSQSVEYSTLATQKWLDLAKSEGITPILFPEHPQRGRLDEGEYVHNIHKGISNVQSTCLAPVGLVWNRVLEVYPSTSLHADDGNHASYLGRYLTSLVFYEVITGESADLLEYSPEINVSETQQAAFGQIVSEVISQHKACPWD